MHNFEYRQGELYCEQVPVSQIAKQVGTPCYVYSHATLIRHIRAYDNAFKNIPHLMAFAMKANSNLAILRLMAKEGSGVDIVSGGELFRALKAGVSPSKIVFAGVGKNAEEIRDALKAEILMFNIESSAEMHAINDVAASVGKGGRTAGGGTGNANGFSKPVMVLSSPEGIAASTQQSVHLTADEHVNTVARKNVIFAAGKSLLASVMDGISLFAQKLGIKLIAAKGKVDIQALSDAMNLLAQLDVKVESATGRLILTAKEEVWLGAGGSYISIKGAGIENVTTGHILERCASWDKPGGASATNRTRTEPSSAVARASSNTRRVFPTPPGPMSVMRRKTGSASHCPNASMSTSRPMRTVSGSGRNAWLNSSQATVGATARAFSTNASRIGPVRSRAADSARTVSTCGRRRSPRSSALTA